jgi:hypothetical protein
VFEVSGGGLHLSERYVIQGELGTDALTVFWAGRKQIVDFRK